ncbi:MAG TPA: type II toxin-antitoxin system HigB family toxin [Armatimonadota bacterium]|jgi:mRNA interferase HigB
MRVISQAALREFWRLHPDAERPLRAWYQDTSRAVWRSPADIKQSYRNASILGANRVVFNIRGNTYRLVVYIHYETGYVYVRFLGTHAQYNRIDARTI